MLYLKAFEVTKGPPLSVAKIGASNQWLPVMTRKPANEAFMRNAIPGLSGGLLGRAL
jgi:hypothetical protein